MYLHSWLTVVTRTETGFIFKCTVHYMGAIRFEPSVFIALVHRNGRKLCDIKIIVIMYN